MLTNRFIRRSHLLNQITNMYKRNLYFNSTLSQCSDKQINNSSLHNISKASIVRSTYTTRFHIFRHFSTTKLSKQQIQQSSYDELVNKITKLYNYQQYKIPSSLALLQIHHQYRIFKPGDWVLDIGAGPNWGWTNLALKLTHTSNNSNKVISNDLKQRPDSKQNNICITGNFLQQQIRAKIAMNLIDRQVNTILIDATPKFSGNQQQDARYTIQIFVQAMHFAQHYLKKGGTIVFKTIQSSSSLSNQQQAKFFFNEVYRYKSASFRIDSPAFFYVLKGYMMNDNLQGLASLLKQYAEAKNSYSKTKVVEKYRQKYAWDPVMIITNQAKQNIIKLKADGKKNKQIAKLYESDPYIKVGQLLQLLDKIQDKNSNPIQKIKAESKLLTGKTEFNIQLPQTQQQFAQVLLKNVQQIARQQKQKRERKLNKKKGKRNNAQIQKIVQKKAPLAENEVYMKSTLVKAEDQKDKNIIFKHYTQQDLNGFNSQDPFRSISRIPSKSIKQQNIQNYIEIEKLVKSFPDLKQAFEKNNLDVEKDYKKTQQEFIQKFFSGQINQDDDNNKSKSNKAVKQQYMSPQVQQEEEFGSNLKTKDSVRNKNKYRNLSQKAQKSSFQFEDDKKYDQFMQSTKYQQNAHLEQQQDIKSSRVQYLRSKPKKTDKNTYKQRSQQNMSNTPRSYFKTRNRGNKF